MNALFTTLGIVVVAFIFAAFLVWYNQEPKCEHKYGPPVRTIEGEWKEHKYTMPHAALAGKVFHVYRREVTLRHKCEKCGVLKFTDAYDQKPHESDTAIVPFPPSNWQPEPMPAPLTFEQLEKLNK